MAVIYAGSEADAFNPQTSQTYVHEATSGRFEANASRGAMLVTSGTSELICPLPSTYTSFWFHVCLYQELAPGSSADYILFETTAGTEAPYKIEINSDGTWTFKRYKSGAFTTIGSTASAVLVSALGNIDIQVVKHASTGTFNVYKDGASIFAFTGNTDTDNNVGRIHFKGVTGATSEMNISQVIFADESTIGWKLSTLYPDGAGSNTAWTGAYTTVDEFVYDSADYAETNATGQTSTFTAANINGAYSTYNVKGVIVAGRLSNDSGSAVADAQAALRTGGVNYFSSNLSLTKDGNEYSKQAVWSVNPGTTASWSQSEVNALEIGMKSV